MNSQLSFPTFNSQPADLLKWHTWVFEMTEPYIKGRVLEINSGSSAIASIFEKQHIPIHLSDPDKINRQRLRAKFKSTDAIRAIHNFDFLRMDFTCCYSADIGAFATIIGLNVIKNDHDARAAIRNASSLLQEEGHLIVVIPSFTALYTGAEIHPDERKRFDQQPLKKYLDEFKILKIRYFNLQPTNLIAFNQLKTLALIIARKL